MKTTAKIRKNFIAAIVMLAAMSFTACSSGENNDVVSNEVTKTVAAAENNFSFTLRAFSADKDITSKGDMTSASLYIFDESNDFVKQMTVEKSAILNGQTIQVTVPGSKRITVIAWGGVTGKGEEIAKMNTANIISDLTVSLKQNNGVASIPSDMFYGQIELNSNQTKSDIAVLSLARKVSSLDVVIAGAAKKFGTTEGDYYFRVKQSKSVINSKGELTGDNVEYIIPARVSGNGSITTDQTVIFPSSNVVIELYRNDVMVYSVSGDKNGNNLSAAAGSKLCVSADMTRASSTAQIDVVSWAAILANVQVG